MFIEEQMMFRILKTTGNAHRPPPILFLDFIDAFILKGARTKLALTCNWKREQGLQSTSCLWMTPRCWAPPIRAPSSGGG